MTNVIGDRGSTRVPWHIHATKIRPGPAPRPGNGPTFVRTMEEARLSRRDDQGEERDVSEERNPGRSAAEAAPFPTQIIDHEVPTSIADAAAMCGVEVHQLQKSMVVRTSEDSYVLVLVPGDSVIDWKKLRAALGVSRLSLAPQDEAEKATGFKRGTITPLGMARDLPVVVDASIEGTRISVGGGAPGLNFVMEADDLIAHLGARVADIAKPAG